MNAASRALEQSTFDIYHVQHLIFSKRNIFLMLLIMAIFITGFSLVSVKDKNRRLFSELATLEKTRNELNVQWSQLLLEQHTWSNQSRIQYIAQKNLVMGIPSSQKSVVIRN